MTSKYSIALAISSPFEFWDLEIIDISHSEQSIRFRSPQLEAEIAKLKFSEEDMRKAFYAGIARGVDREHTLDVNQFMKHYTEERFEPYVKNPEIGTSETLPDA